MREAGCVGRKTMIAELEQDIHVAKQEIASIDFVIAELQADREKHLARIAQWENEITALKKRPR